MQIDMRRTWLYVVRTHALIIIHFALRIAPRWQSRWNTRNTIRIFIIIITYYFQVWCWWHRSISASHRIGIHRNIRRDFVVGIISFHEDFFLLVPAHVNWREDDWWYFNCFVDDVVWLHQSVPTPGNTMSSRKKKNIKYEHRERKSSGTSSIVCLRALKWNGSLLTHLHKMYKKTNSVHCSQE